MSDSSSGQERSKSIGDTQADPIDEAIKSALANLKGGDDLTEIERTLNLVKLGSEIRKIDSERTKADQDAKKAAIDASLASRQMRHSLRVNARPVGSTDIIGNCDGHFVRGQ